MRVREGRCEIAFEPLAAEDVVRAVGVAATVARATRGEAPVAVATGARATRLTTSGSTPIYMAWLAGFFLCMPLGMAIAFLAPMRAWGAPLVCGPGGTLRETSCGDGGCLECSDDPDRWATLHYLACVMIAWSLIAIVGVVIASTKPSVRGR
jgi:hypothetical protein